MASAQLSDSSARRRVISVFLTQGLTGLLIILWVTWLRHDQTVEILRRLGPDAPILIIIFTAFASMLALLKFELTDLIFVSLVLTAYMCMFPLFGVVLTSWIAVTVSVLTRILAMYEIGPVKIQMRDPVTEWIKAFGLFGTYGIPVLVASTLYEKLGGELPAMHA